MNGIELAQKRASIVLQAMVEAGFITRTQRDDALRTRPKLATSAETQGNQYFVDWVMERLPGLVGRPKVDLIVNDARSRVAALWPKMRC